MKIKNIFLDFAGVISKESHLAKGYLYPNLKHLLKYEDLDKRYKLARLGKISFSGMIKSTPKELWLKHLKKAKTTKRAKSAIRNLSKNYKIFVASNHVPVLFEKELNSFELTDCFTKVFVSYKLKTHKPKKEFYELILKKSKSKAIESVFVDDAKWNLVEPKKMGFVTIWFDNLKNKKDERNKIYFKEDYKIKSLEELPKILEKLNN
jgi:HAD superfamily hydrolase (TIGR01509 family)